MAHTIRFSLVDSNGVPLDPRLESSLNDLLPRFRRQFPTLDDETTVVEVMEEAGRRISDREKRKGSIIKLHAYAWVTLRSVAISRIRRASMRLTERTVDGDTAERLFTSAQASTGTVAEIERDILIRQLLALLTHEERLVTTWKAFGLSSDEIAVRLGRNAISIDTIYCRAKTKLRMRVAKSATALR